MAVALEKQAEAMESLEIAIDAALGATNAIQAASVLLKEGKLKEARERATQARSLLAKGLDSKGLDALKMLENELEGAELNANLAKDGLQVCHGRNFCIFF